MKHRHWLLWAMVLPLGFAFGVIRFGPMLQIWPTYGDSDIQACTQLAIALLAAWVVLEVVHQLRLERTGKCECGYSLRGIRCPECGRDQGGESVKGGL